MYSHEVWALFSSVSEYLELNPYAPRIHSESEISFAGDTEDKRRVMFTGMDPGVWNGEMALRSTGSFK